MENQITVIERAEIETFQNDGMGAIAKAKEVARGIVDNATLTTAAEMMLDAKRRIRVIEKRFVGTPDAPGPETQAKVAHAAIRNMKNELIEPYERIERDILKPAIAAFNAEQDQKRRAEEDRQREEQKKRIEDERLKAAAQLEKDGENEAAQELIEAPIEAPVVVIPKEQAPPGISYRENWKFRVVDDSKIPREYMTVDEKKIGGVVRALKGETRIAGVEVYSEQVVAGRL